MNTNIRNKSYRFFEILPGALIWLTLFLMFFVSWRVPVAVAIFIILYDLYWLLRAIYLFVLLQTTFKIMRANVKINWLKRCEELKNKDLNFEKVYHLVILPMYKESYEIVEETFVRLANVNYPKEKIIVVLATEEQGGRGVEETVSRIQEKFGDKFFRMLVTKHPTDIAGEIHILTGRFKNFIE